MTSTAIARIERLMSLATGDEKHDSSSLSTLDVLWVLYDRILRFDPENPRWENRDRFVLSKGHGCVSYYAILADKGFLPISTLETFMQYDSILGAHPDRNHDSRVFVLVGDGECNEGSIWEAVLLAGNQQLSNLICIAINNHSSSLELGDLAAKFAAFGWASTTIDGHDHEQIYESLSHRDSTHPTAIIAEVG